MNSSPEDASEDLTERKPYDDEIDVHGLTHVGKLRKENQDHFLICSLRRKVDVHLTSLPETIAEPAGDRRLAMLAMVADGVGGAASGERASRMAVQAITEYVAYGMQCYYTADAADEEAFSQALVEAALKVHEKVSRRSQKDSDLRGMATTLTLWFGLWPRSYLLQVGDSRCYVLRDGELTQLSRDQTMAQELIDQGVMTRTDAHGTRLANVLSSSIGGSQTAPTVTRLEQSWGIVGLLCSDGLTKHVSDDQIRDRLRSMRSAKQVCEDLLQDALDGGGTDNITIIVGRAVPRT